MAILTSGGIVQWLGRLTTRRLGRGAQFEYQVPITITKPVVLSFEDTAGSAIGDSEAAAEGAGGVALPYSRSVEQGYKRTLGRGPRVEFQTSFPIRAPQLSFGDGAGDASGDSTASGALDALADFAGAASGDSTASGDLDALADFAGAASGDSTASGALDALADFAGAASGDSTVSGTLDALGDFAGAASGDSTASGEGGGGIVLPFSRSIERGAKQTLGRGWRLELSAPTSLRAPSGAVTLDADGSAIGDATASGGLDAFGDFAGSVIGDATVSGVLEAFADFAGSAIGDSTASGDLNALADFAGAASGDATASGTLDALADFAGAAQGDATVSGDATALADLAGSAIGDATASGDLTALADFAGAAAGDAIASAEGTSENNLDTDGSAIGDATASGALEAFADVVGSAIGDSTASGELDALADFAGSASGDASASAEGASDNNQDCAGSAVGDSTCEGFIEDATPAVVTPPVVAEGTGGQVFRGAWTDRIKKPKRKKRLDDLDEMIAELRSRIEEVPVESTAEDIYQRTLRVSQALANQSDPSLQAIDNQLVLLQEAINEIDDEEAILLLAA
jgi:hypothetical protein